MPENSPMHQRLGGKVQFADQGDSVNYEPINTVEYIELYDKLYNEKMKQDPSKETKPETQANKIAGVSQRRRTVQQKLHSNPIVGDTKNDYFLKASGGDEDLKQSNLPGVEWVKDSEKRIVDLKVKTLPLHEQTF